MLLVTPVLTVHVTITLEHAGDTLSASAFHQALAVTGAIDLVGPVATVVVAVTHPLLGNAAPVAAAVLLCGIAIWGK